MNAANEGGRHESRGRAWLFGAWIITLLVVAAAGVFALQQRQTALRSAARAIARHHLASHHWRELETNREFRPVIESLSRGWSPPDSGSDWSAKFVSMAKLRPQDLDAFDDEALRQIQSGDDEVSRGTLGETFRYAVALRVGADCLVCHPNSANGPTKVGDLIAVLRVDQPEHR